MNDEKKRQAIAAALGWIDIVGLIGIPPGCSKPPGSPRHFVQTIPNYLEDLNVMAAAFRWYRYNKANQFFFLEYQQNLWRVVTGREELHSDIDYMHSLAMESVINATARQRADAFIATLTP